ncbi:hypothetical protein WS68_03645 [Burkholderia sp. TSV86]|nr:hypothetical protein WS68_03645 [Burkholderia sp. TSV86]
MSLNLRGARANDRRGCVYRQIGGARNVAWVFVCGASLAFVFGIDAIDRRGRRWAMRAAARLSDCRRER